MIDGAILIFVKDRNARRFISATDAKSLLDALDRIGDNVAGGTVGDCS